MTQTMTRLVRVLFLLQSIHHTEQALQHTPPLASTTNNSSLTHVSKNGQHVIGNKESSVPYQNEDRLQWYQDPGHTRTRMEAIRQAVQVSDGDWRAINVCSQTHLNMH